MVNDPDPTTPKDETADTQDEVQRASEAVEKSDITRDEGYIACEVVFWLAEIVSQGLPEPSNTSEIHGEPSALFDAMNNVFVMALVDAFSDEPSASESLQIQCNAFMSASSELASTSYEIYEQQSAEIYKGVERGIMEWVALDVPPGQGDTYGF